MNIDLQAGVTYKLSDLLNTKYLIKYQNDNIKTIFDRCEEIYNETGEKVIIDIAECKFNPSNYTSVTTYRDVIDFIDTDNEVINSMLEHNSRVTRMRELTDKGVISMIDIPTTFKLTEVIEYLQNLDKLSVYRLKSPNEMNGIVPDLSIFLAMSINCIYPEIGVDISAQATRYFELFKRIWTYQGLVKRDAYNVLLYNSIIKVSAIGTTNLGENIYYIPGRGEVTERLLNEGYDVIPFEFGTVNLKGKGKNADPELEHAFSRIGKEIDKIVRENQKKKGKKKLTSVLTTIERR